MSEVIVFESDVQPGPNIDAGAPRLRVGLVGGDEAADNSS